MAESRKLIGKKAGEEVEVSGCWGNVNKDSDQCSAGKVMCFGGRGVMVAMSLGGCEGLGDRGKYRIKGKAVKLSSESPRWGWNHFFKAPNVTCELRLIGLDRLSLSRCSDGSSDAILNKVDERTIKFHGSVIN